MNLVRISEDMVIDKDKVLALMGKQHNGKSYTHIYLVGDKQFLVNEYVGDVEKRINKSEDK